MQIQQLNFITLPYSLLKSLGKFAEESRMKILLYLEYNDRVE